MGRRGGRGGERRGPGRGGPPGPPGPHAGGGAGSHLRQADAHVVGLVGVRGDVALEGSVGDVAGGSGVEVLAEHHEVQPGLPDRRAHWWRRLGLPCGRGGGGGGAGVRGGAAAWGGGLAGGPPAGGAGGSRGRWAVRHAGAPERPAHPLPRSASSSSPPASPRSPTWLPPFPPAITPPPKPPAVSLGFSPRFSIDGRSAGTLHDFGHSASSGRRAGALDLREGPTPLPEFLHPESDGRAGRSSGACGGGKPLPPPLRGRRHPFLALSHCSGSARLHTRLLSVLPSCPRSTPRPCASRSPVSGVAPRLFGNLCDNEGRWYRAGTPETGHGEVAAPGAGRHAPPSDSLRYLLPAGAVSGISHRLPRVSARKLRPEQASPREPASSREGCSWLLCRGQPRSPPRGCPARGIIVRKSAVATPCLPV